MKCKIITDCYTFLVAKQFLCIQKKKINKFKVIKILCFTNSLYSTVYFYIYFILRIKTSDISRFVFLLLVKFLFFFWGGKGVENLLYVQQRGRSNSKNIFKLFVLYSIPSQNRENIHKIYNNIFIIIIVLHERGL